jgi:chorismate dehydratase
MDVGAPVGAHDADAAARGPDGAIRRKGSGLRGSTLASDVEKIDLGLEWTSWTGLPFVWACWVGRAGALRPDDVAALGAARDAGVAQSDRVALEYFRDQPQHQERAVRYLRDNIKYDLGGAERAGLELFYRYAAEIGAAPPQRPLRIY